MNRALPLVLATSIALAAAGCTHEAPVAVGHDDAGPTCAPETDRLFCERVGATCGAVTESDNCDRPRTVDCGQCASGTACTADHQCACVPESDAEICARLGRECDVVLAQDNCGANRSADCGTCPAGELCSAAAHTCEVCTPQSDADFCAAQAKQCGPFTAQDPCSQLSRSPDCGGCDPGFDCDAATNQCGPCVAETVEAFCQRLGKTCGTVTAPDNCRLEQTYDCGTCTGTDFCDDDTNTCHACVAESDAAFCQRNLIPCGPFEGIDNCLTARSVTNCGACGAGEVCTPAHQCLLCTQETDAQLCDRLGAYCDSVSDVDNCGISRTAACGTCTAPATCRANHACAAGTAPTNDDCAQPERLHLAANASGALEATATGDTSGAADDFTGSCGAMDGGDVVYRFTLTTQAQVSATVTRDARSPALAPAVVIRGAACASAAAADELACAVAFDAVATARALLDPGTYYLLVDATGGTRGAFSLRVTATTPLPGDSCANVLSLYVDPLTGLGSTLGDTTGAFDDTASSCQSSSTGGDLVYALVVPGPSPRKAEIDLLPSASIFTPIVSLRARCDQLGSELGCARPTGTAHSVHLAISQLQPGTYWLWVDGASAAAGGAFTLDVALHPQPPPPANDACSSPTPIALGNAGYATLTGTTTDARDDYRGGCSSANDPHSGGDVVYSLTLSAAQNLAAAVTASAPSSSGFRPALYLRGTCADAASQRACANEASGGGTATLIAANLAAGTYYLVVDGLAGTEGDFSLSVATYGALTNDACGAAAPLSFDIAGDAFAAGTTTGALSDAASNTSGRCNGAGSGPDLVYSFDLAQVSIVSISVTPVGTGLRPVVYLRRSNCSSTALADEVSCSAALAAGAAAQLTVKNLAAGRYWLWVDSMGVDAGPFALAVHTTAPPPLAANDTCAAPTALVPDATTGRAMATGDLDAALGDYETSCALVSGPDLVYSLQLTQPQSVAFAVTPTTGTLKPLLYLQTTCGDLTGEKGCSANWTAGAADTLSFPVLGVGTYYLVVDSASASDTGPFTLEAQLGPAPAPPAWDLCQGARSLTWSGTTATVSDDTSLGYDDERSYCSTASAPLNGPDLVYQFDLTAPARVTATVTAASYAPAYRPAVSIRRGCAPEEEVACAGNVSGGHSASVAVSLDPGTWYVVVDGVSSATNGSAYGAFTLTLSQATAIDADGCGNPAPITLDPTTGIGVVLGTLSTATASGDGSCLPDTGADRVYSLTLTSEKTVQIAVANPPTLPTPTLYPEVYLRSTCAAPGSELACKYQFNTTTAAGFTLNRLAPGTYYVWVDACTPSNQGSFELTVTTTTPAQPAPANDSCAAPQPLVVDGANGGAQGYGDTSWASADSSGGCQSPLFPFTGPEVVYSFTLSQAATVYAAVSRLPGAPTAFSPAVYLRSNCADPATEVACSTTTGFGSASVVQALPAGTYYLFVDGQRGSSGAFMLAVSARASTTTPPAPSLGNDGCASPQALVFDASGLAVAAGSTSGLSDDSSGTCASTTASADAVYTFTLSAPRRLTVDLSPAASTMNPMVYLQTTCGSSASEIACASSATYAPAHLLLGRLAAGTYYLWVDEPTPTRAGPFVLSVLAEVPPPLPANDTCAGATPIALDPLTGTGSATGNTFDGVDDYSSYCANAANKLSGPDLVYSFQLPASASVTATLTRTGSGGVYRPAVSLRASCDPVDEVACARDATGVGVSTAAATLLPGTYYVFVDGVASATPGSEYGPFTLALSTGPAILGDSCGSAIALVPDPVTGVVSASGDLTAATPSGAGSCPISGASASDLVYSLTLTQPRAVYATASSALGSAALYIRRTCSNPTSEVACAYDASDFPRVSLARLNPGTYYLWVDGYSSAVQGPFTLTVQTSAPAQPAPSNDTCASPQAVSLDAQHPGAHFTGDLAAAGDDYAGTCGSRAYPILGGDVVYAVSVAQDSTLYAVVNKDPADTRVVYPSLYLRSTCASDAPADEVACSSTNGLQSASLSASVRPGTYYLIVDGQKNYTGKFLLDVVARPSGTPPATSNDTCAGAEPLALDASGWTMVAGTTVGMANNAVGSCSATSSAPDLVYSLTTTGPKHLAFDVMGGSDHTPMLHVRSTTCSDPSAEVGCGYTTNPGVPLHLTLTSRPAGTYYLWLDGYSTSAGLFTLQVTARDPAPAPANDQCAGAQPIALNLTSPVQVSASTLDSSDDYTGACATAAAPFNGPDNVYSFTATAKLLVSAKLTAVGPTYRPAVYIRSTCATASSDDRCAYSASPGPGSPAIAGAVVTPGTWYLVVDGVSGTAGDYTLEVTAASYSGVGSTVSSVVTFPTSTSIYGMTVDATELVYDVAMTSIGAVGKSGGTPYTLGPTDGMTSEVVGVDLTEANGSVFTLDTSNSNTVGRLWKIKDATGGWLNPPLRWDVPAGGTTTSAWDPSPCNALTFDGTDLIIVGGGISPREPVVFFAVSAAQAELPRRLGAGTGVYQGRGIAADANYFYVMGRSTAATNGGSLWRFDRQSLSAAPLRIFDTPLLSTMLQAVRLDSLTSPSNLYVRLPVVQGSPIHVVLNPASASPRPMGPLALPGMGATNTDFGMTYDRSTNTLYYVETSTAAAGVIWQVQ